MSIHYAVHNLTVRYCFFSQVEDDSFIGTIEEIISKITETNIADLVLGIVCVAILICMRVRQITIGLN